MAYYLGRFTERPRVIEGTRINEFFPTGLDIEEPYSIIDLRPDGGATAEGGGLSV